MKRIIILMVLMLGVFLGNVATASAQSRFTINGVGAETYYECGAPCTVEVHDPDPGSYRWDFTSDNVPDVAGNPVSWTYSEPGVYGILQEDASGNYVDSRSLEVVPAAEAAPEDIELLSPTNGSFPLRLEFTTSRQTARFVCTEECSIELVGRTGPDGAGKYHYYVRLDRADPGLMIRVEAWNTSQQYSIRDTFPIEASGGLPLFAGGKATWTVNERQNRCVVKLTKRFETLEPYTAKLAVVGKVKALRTGKNVVKKGDSGSQKVRAKVVLDPLFINRLPGNAVATLTVTTDGETFREKDKLRLKPSRCT